ncbi:hypothetical protein CAEBREN_25672 [Caenorhabditis brenneri]|uniref:Uncharacterized protein n=1 Tax=Caenorhabditis brenneri TaxID=135651 RepID=G0P2Z5_CAEBE|nr:hypothetical protein CAEBREN_25672 [Caenorhabditis brenneri]
MVYKFERSDIGKQDLMKGGKKLDNPELLRDSGESEWKNPSRIVLENRENKNYAKIESSRKIFQDSQGPIATFGLDVNKCLTSGWEDKAKKMDPMKNGIFNILKDLLDNSVRDPRLPQLTMRRSRKKSYMKTSAPGCVYKNTKPTMWS